MSITIGGVKSNEAATQMRGVMAALLKPGTDLKDTLLGLGMASGEDAIATWGLAGTLNQLKVAAEDSGHTVSKMFPNIRGLNGVLRLAGAGAEQYAKSLKQLDEVNEATLTKKWSEFVSTDAERTVAAVNQIKNALTVDFGPQVIKAFGGVASGVSHFKDGIGVMASTLPTVGAAAGLAAVAMTGVAIANKLIGQSANAAALQLATEGNAIAMTAAKAATARSIMLRGASALTTPTGIGIAVTAGLIAYEALSQGAAYYERKVNESSRKNQESVRDEFDATIKMREAQADAEIYQKERALKEMEKGVRQSTLEASKEFIKQEEFAKKYGQAEEHAYKNAFDKVLGARRKLTQQLESEEDKTANKALSIQDRIDERERKKEWARNDKGATTSNDVTGAIREAYQAQSTAKDSRQEGIAEQMWGRVDELLQRMQRQGGDTGWLVEHLERQRTDSLRAQKDQQQDLRKEFGGRNRQASANDFELDILAKEIMKLNSPVTVDANGRSVIKSGDEATADSTKAEALTQQFLAKYKASAPDFLESVLGDETAFKEMAVHAKNALESFEIEQIKFAPGVFERISKSIAEAAETAFSSVNESGLVDTVKKITGKGLDNGFNPLLDETFKLYKGDTKTLVEKKKYEREIADSESMFKGGRGSFPELAWQGRYLGQKSLGQAEYGPNTTAALKLSTDLYGQGSARPDELATLTKLVQGTKEEALSEGQRLALDNIVTALTKRSESISNVQKLPELSIPTGLRELFEIQAGSSANLISSIDSLTESMNRQISRALGGSAYLANGGRGTDTIPAMLSPGEMVMNSAASRKFASQLVAMNAGKTSASQNAGNTTNVGDISVTVNSNGSGKEIARDVMGSIKRELRKGTFSLY